MLQLTRSFTKEETLEVFNEIYKTLPVIKSMEEDNRIWDMNATYLINWACLWNKHTRLGQTCKIWVKDSRIAIVQFTNDPVIGLLQRVYRLEDLSLLD